jgi:hypothetical protein
MPSGDIQHFEQRGDIGMIKLTTTDPLITNAATVPTYEPWPHDFPNVEPTIRFLFHGLMVFFFDGKIKAEVGIHNHTHATSGHPHKHNLSINIWTRVLGTCPPEPVSIPIGNPSTLSKDIEFVAPSSRLLDGTYVFLTDDFDRTQSISDERDWRWILDLERDIYPDKKLTKHRNRFKPGLNMNRGLFYTFHRTRSSFKKAPASGTSSPSSLGHVAHVVGANIYLDPFQTATLSIKRETYSFLAAPGLTYQIDIDNSCTDCRFNPNGGTKEERNDFYLYYDLFDVPTGEPVFDLIVETERAPRRPTGICPEVTSLSKLSTDPAPCGPAGAGGSKSS